MLVLFEDYRESSFPKEPWPYHCWNLPCYYLPAFLSQKYFAIFRIPIVPYRTVGSFFNPGFLAYSSTIQVLCVIEEQCSNNESDICSFICHIRLPEGGVMPYRHRRTSVIFAAFYCAQLFS